MHQGIKVELSKEAVQLGIELPVGAFQSQAKTLVTPSQMKLFNLAYPIVELYPKDL